MKILMAIFFALIAFFAAMPATAAEFEGAKKGLPSLVMLSTPT